MKKALTLVMALALGFAVTACKPAEAPGPKDPAHSEGGGGGDGGSGGGGG
jgi:Spy/CpxP family protein refolding chaperone